MRRAIRGSRGSWGALLLLVALAWPAHAEEPILLTEGAGGILDLEGERRLEIVGLQGSILVRQGKTAEIRFAARSMEDRKVERPVALWLDESVLRLTAVEGAASEPVRLEVSVAPELAVRLDLSDSKVQLASLHGATRVRGERLDLTTRTLAGSLEVDVAEGTVRVSGVTEETRIEGSALDLKVEQATGGVWLNVDEGEAIRLSSIHGGIDGDVRSASVVVDGVWGRVRLRVDEGSLLLANCDEGAELELSGSPLELQVTKGPIEVDSDSGVRFQDHEGDLTIRTRESVHGAAASDGALSIETSGAEVSLEEFEATATVRGDNLELHTVKSKGHLIVETIYSNLLVEQAEERVTLQNEFGSVVVREAAKLVEVINLDGDVRLEDVRGPVMVDAEGGEVSVGWKAFTSHEKSEVQNLRGDVHVSVPLNQRCKYDLQAPRGDVVTDIPEIEVSDDGHYASGVLQGGGRAAPYVKQPTILAISNGDLYFNGVGVAQAEVED